MNKPFLFTVFVIVTILTACNKTEDYPTSPLSDYNLQTPGKYIIYKLDSLLFINFGKEDTVVSYFAKDSVDALVTDSLGRLAYRILHYLSTSQSGPWQPDNTFLTVPTTYSVEFIENNLRYIKLQSPIQNNFSWKGNAYIDTYDVNIAVSDIPDWNLTYLDDWDYIYQDVYQSAIIGSIQLDSTITVTERDETIGDTTDINSYSERNFSIEQYAKGIGLVYRNFLHREYQPPTPSSDGYYVGYGVLFTMLDHN
jgi:hypothetical protein